MLTEVNDFILTYTDLPQEKIYRGWQNRAALPTTNEYCVYSVVETKRVGTNEITHDSEAETNAIRTLREYTIEIAFYDLDNERALNRASKLETLCRSYVGTKFFKERNIGSLYSEDIRYLPFTDSNKQFLHKYIIHIHLTQWDEAVVEQEYANEVHFERIRNVDEFLHQIR